MNYFPFHIGDFDRATRHLTRIERSIYIDLILLYYDTEHQLTSDLPALCRKVVARTDEEKVAVTAILDEFFIPTPSGWFHERCEEVLADYRKSLSQASAAGKASANARAARKAAALASNETSTTVQRLFNDRSTTVDVPLNERATEAQREGNDTATNQEPITNNHKPKTKTVKTAPPGGDAELFPNVDSQVVLDFKALRHKAKAPITPTAMQEIAKQAGLAGLSLEDALRVCCSRGWRGFKAEWVLGDRRAGARPAHSGHVDLQAANQAAVEDMMRKERENAGG